MPIFINADFDIRGKGAYQYRLYTYDVWGNSKEGFEVNDVFNTSTYINIKDYSTLSDYQINRLLRCKGIVWEGEAECLYGHCKRTGKPQAELRLVESEYYRTNEYDILIDKRGE